MPITAHMYDHFRVFILSHCCACFIRMWLRTEFGCEKALAQVETGHVGESRG